MAMDGERWEWVGSTLRDQDGFGVISNAGEDPEPSDRDLRLLAAAPELLELVRDVGTDRLLGSPGAWRCAKCLESTDVCDSRNPERDGVCIGSLARALVKRVEEG